MRISPELTLIIVALITILSAYFLIYPRVAKSDGIKLAIYDIGASLLNLLFAGLIFWDTGIPFSLHYIEVNWVIFAILSYGLLEIPFMIWYFKRYRVMDSFNH